MNVPNHMAIIVDGNGRWAQKRGLSRSFGHKAGSENLQKIVLYAKEKGIKYLSLYVLSCDNLKRSKDEVKYLFNLFITTFKKKKEVYVRENIKVVISGVKDNLPDNLLKTIGELVEITKNNTGMIVNFCLNYSSKLELFEAFKKMSKLDFSTLEVNDINKYLFQELPPIDFLIRTSGEKRLSDFMLYQAAYAELYFPEVLFPDFNYQEFDKSLEEYAKRDRRFGGVKYEKKSN